MQLNINGQIHRVTVPESEFLLWVLRDELGLTATKPGCGVGICGSCTVLLDGQPVHACKTTTGEAAGHPILTLEGLATVDPAGETQLHPVQQAFLDGQVSQCGWCLAGQILTAVALLETNAQPTEAQIIEALNKVYCRCGTYGRVKAAVARATILRSTLKFTAPLKPEQSDE